MELRSLQDLYLHELKDLYSAEKQLIKALPKMAEAARFDQLRELFEQHLGETETQIERINECFELLGKSARAKPCKGMMGLVEEGQDRAEAVGPVIAGLVVEGGVAGQAGELGVDAGMVGARAARDGEGVVRGGGGQAGADDAGDDASRGGEVAGVQRARR